jgi:hypothetical protein
MLRTEAAASPGAADSASSASWLSRTTPAAPPATAATAVRKPIPPQAQTGTSIPGAERSCWRRTKLLNSPTLPPLSAPRAISPWTPARMACRACSRSVTSASTRYPASSAGATRSVVSVPSTTVCGALPSSRWRSSGERRQSWPIRIPNGSGVDRRSLESSSRDRPSPVPRSSTPRAPARHTAAASPASGWWKGVIPMTMSSSGEAGLMALRGASRRRCRGRWELGRQSVGQGSAGAV